MDVNKELFGVFCFYAGVVTVKMILMSFATARQRFKNMVFISEEDIAGQKGAKMGVNPDVERVRRAHMNDIENIVPFLILGFLYLFTQPSVSTATNLYRVFVGARIIHSIVYLLQVPQPARAIAFFAGIGVNLYMGYKIITTFM